MVGISGIGSGMDIGAIVTALVNAEKAPKEAQLARLGKASTTRLSALGQLKGALSEFREALRGLNKTSLFENRSATSSNSTLLTATASKTAQAGSYSLQVMQLATGSKVASAALAGGFSSGAGGTLTVKLGAADPGIDVVIGPDASLGDIRDALNLQLKDTGITANLVTNPSDGATRLVMSSSNTGAGKDVQVEATGNLASLAIGTGTLDSADPASSGVLEASGNARFSIDGLVLESPSNEVTGAIPDVTFNLLAAEQGKTVTVTVDHDRSGVAESIKAFVEAYNKLISTSNSLTKVTPGAEGSAPTTGGLVGDATVRQLLSGVRGELANPASQDAVRVLADIGITTQKNGTLKIDDAKLETALKDNFDAVGAFLTGADGLMSRVDKRIEGFIQTGGLLDQRIKGLETTLSGIDKQKETLARRIEQLQTRLFAQFNAMDSLVAQLTQTSDRLTQSLANLPGIVKKDN